MQASSFAVTGNEPAVSLGMLRTRIVPAFVFVAFVHAAVIGIVVATIHESAPRAVKSSAIVAQLLRPEPQAARAAVQSPPAPRRSHSRPEPHPPRASEQPARKSPPAPPRQEPVTAPTAVTPSPAPSTASHPPMQSAASAQSTTAAAAASTAAAPDARDTIALAAPKHVAHADCRIVKPAYPELSKRREETGTATVRFVIGTTGAIDSVTLAKSSGFPRLDDAAVAALRESTCRPYVENGSPIRAAYEQAFTFGLDEN